MIERTLYIICGGNSSRMGSDKSLLEFEGETLLDRIIRRTSPHFDEVVLLSGSKNYDVPVRQLKDTMESAGPLGGLWSAMLESEADYITIIPVDVPLIADSTIRYLSMAKPYDSEVLIAGNSQSTQPLAGIYSTGLLTDLEDYMLSGKRSVLGFLDLLHVDTFPVLDHELANANTPEEFQILSAK